MKRQDKLSLHKPKRCCTRIIFPNRSGIAGGAPNSIAPRCSCAPANLIIALVADQPCAIRCAPSAVTTGVAKDDPHQSAQPDVFCSPSGNVGEMYRQRTASGKALASIAP